MNIRHQRLNGSHIGKSRRPAGRRRLRLETLETRRMLATITVTSLADNLNLDGHVTLREALRAAELNISVDGSAAGSDTQMDHIIFDGHLEGTIALGSIGDNSVGASALVVSSSVTIQGNGNKIIIGRTAFAPEMRLLRVSTSGNLTLEGITLAGGLARGAAAATPGAKGGEAFGGAIYNEGTLTIRASTLHDNQAIGGEPGAGGVGGTARGGAIFSNGGEVTIVNSTLASNASIGGNNTSGIGGGVYVVNGALSVYNSTITDNLGTGARNVFVFGQGTSASAAIYSSIITTPGGSASVFDFNATFEDGGQITVEGADNLIGRQNSFASITVSTADPLLAPLADNGGPTPTRALQSGSPAIDHGSNLLELSDDQRGLQRVRGTRADIGAFEVQSDAPPSLPGDYNNDGSIDAADYVVWRRTLGNTVAQFSGADGNGTSNVDAGDYTVWRDHFSGLAQGSGGQATAGSTRTATVSGTSSAVRSVELPPAAHGAALQDFGVMAPLARPAAGELDANLLLILAATRKEPVQATTVAGQAGDTLSTDSALDELLATDGLMAPLDLPL